MVWEFLVPLVGRLLAELLLEERAVKISIQQVEEAAVDPRSTSEITATISL